MKLHLVEDDDTTRAVAGLDSLVASEIDAVGHRIVHGGPRFRTPVVVDAAVEARQVARLQEVRRRRDGARVRALLDRLETEARNPDANLMPLTIEAVKARATLGEIVARLRSVFGTYTERPVF